MSIRVESEREGWTVVAWLNIQGKTERLIATFTGHNAHFAADSFAAWAKDIWSKEIFDC